MPSSPKVLIIIVTWNKKQYILDLLKSLETIHYQQHSFDIVVVDNASTDGTQEQLKKHYPEIKLICNQHNLGGTGGFNTGLDYAFSLSDKNYDYLWLLDNDVQVNKNALMQLTAVLEHDQSIAVAGSTMMQMDYPWRINEMGADVNKQRCSLILHRHLDEIAAFKNRSLNELLAANIDLCDYLKQCPKYTEVDYVAAASLLIRYDVAKKAGLWDDYFIHFDDVEWCLRISAMGYKVVVSAQSLIWHMSADTKVPDWILYYDNRNALYLLDKHSHSRAVNHTRRWTLKKAFYYALLGKQDLSQLHLDAVDDFKRRKSGKKDINLDLVYYNYAQLEQWFQENKPSTILVPWTIKENRQIFPLLSQLQQQYDLKIDYISQTGDNDSHLNYHQNIQLSRFVLFRYLKYLSLMNHYDLLLQSDYEPILTLSRSAAQTLYLNNGNCSIRKKSSLLYLLKRLIDVIKR
jgi:GT2 family glycosyltransferase